MSIYQPYTYIIGWSDKNIWYYGVRFAKGCNPEDLWVKYFTSSKYVKAFRKSHGEPDIIQIRKTFTNAKNAKLHEEKVLRRMNVRHRNDFLNITDTNSLSSKAMSDGLYRFWNSLSEEERQHRTSNMRSYIRNHGGPISLSKEERSRRSHFMKDVGTKRQASLSNEEKSHFGRIAGMESAKKRQMVKCPHCEKEGPKPSMSRWHFTNCKEKVPR